MIKKLALVAALGSAITTLTPAHALQITPFTNAQTGVRPLYLIEKMQDSPLKEKLWACRNQQMKPHILTIGHRGAPAQLPEHTEEGYIAAAAQGAKTIECDVTFTKDHELVCRHSQSDLATTTNILATPLASKCSVPFTPAEFNEKGERTKDAAATCRTSDITLAEYRTLTPKMDAGNKDAKTIEQFMDATPKFRTDWYSENTKLMTFEESIKLNKKLGVKHTPELKKPDVEMPHNGFTYDNYRQKLVDTLKKNGVAPKDVHMQSFIYEDMLYWLKNTPKYAATAVFLDEDVDNIDKRITEMSKWKADGVKYLAPAQQMLAKSDGTKIIKSDYAKAAQKHGFKIIAWSLERSGPLKNGGGWYYSSIKDITKSDGMTFNMLDFLVKDIGVVGVFSDWPATVTYYGNCMAK